ncbi:uncharacterized protein LOC116774204 isoform X3 [Danaus plexippus]|uniref:uncharacterized protein LOC116774204 isoform X3 n=1 Tax=Danaus plexippus TaxID=13037 RepID=UPI002AB1A27F|nr:uncharacterized protein LOC116774204 isoform X3 [Danaus plexippus]
MSQMLPDTGGMRRAACGDVSTAPYNTSSDNKELLRRQLLSSSKERNVDKCDSTKIKHTRSRQKNRWKLKFHHQALPQEYLDHYEQSLQKANCKKKTQDKQKEQSVENSFTNETFKIWAERLAGVQTETPALTLASPAASGTIKNREERKKKNPAITPSKIMTYEDLPYMGEMTLNNSKPRRGRKPKKADICHLIYENYGTVVPGRPPPSRPSTCPPFKTDPVGGPPRTDLQNRIISSLLERKLSQENRRRFESQPDEPPAPTCVALGLGPGLLHSDREPLNLCIRDLRDLKLQVQKKFGDIYPEVKVERDEADSGRGETPNAISVIQRNENVPPSPRTPPDADDNFPGYVYWPEAGVYMHPLALQTQLLYCQQAEASQKKEGGAGGLAVKRISELLEPERQTDGPREKRVAAAAPAKRKRSAIFIPPVSAGSGTAAPTAEVSICKFKFTGGSKPSLQEKKMLSVDSGGNFRYYSGGGAKGNKGYDFLQGDSARDRSDPAPATRQTDPAVEEQKKKRKSRKTLQREKLEQTFKEKGFLIQTQQLQSAEGATYCKFRQLRKFTRYLFRSWRDYLPGELAGRDGARGGADDPAGPGGT